MVIYNVSFQKFQYHYIISSVFLTSLYKLNDFFNKLFLNFPLEEKYFMEHNHLVFFFSVPLISVLFYNQQSLSCIKNNRHYLRLVCICVLGMGMLYKTKLLFWVIINDIVCCTILYSEDKNFLFYSSFSPKQISHFLHFSYIYIFSQSSNEYYQPNDW